jgi:hypothetical protein
MTWQEPVATLIVGVAVISLVRHFRGLFGSSSPDAQASCHGCDSCESETGAETSAPPLPPRTH